MPRTLASARTLASSRTLRTVNFLNRNDIASLNVEGNGTDGYALVTDFSGIQNIWSGAGGAISFWVNPKSLGPSNAANFFGKGTSANGWIINFANSTVPRFNISFDGGSNGNWRLTGNFLLNEWSFLFMWYKSTDIANVPVPYIGRKGSALVKQTPSVVSSPTGSARDDTGQNLYIGNNTSGNRGCDSLLTDVRFYKGAEPSLAEVQALFYTGADPSSMTLIERWAKGTTSFDTDSGSNNGVITSPATMSSIIPFKVRTLAS